jgi:hypothetical protein
LKKQTFLGYDEAQLHRQQERLGADEPYRTLTDKNGNEVRLKKGAEVEITVEADKDATTPKSKEE